MKRLLVLLALLVAAPATAMEINGELIRARAENLSSDPTCASNAKGRFIFDSDDLLFRVCDGTDWLTLADSGSTIANPLLGALAIQSGNIALTVGADNTATTLTNSTTKNGRIGAAHYTNAEEPVAIAAVTAASGANTVSIGGGTGQLNAATVIDFYTAATTTTTTGTKVGEVSSSGAWTIGPSAGGVRHTFKGAFATVTTTAGGSVSSGTYTANCSTTNFHFITATGDITLDYSNTTTGQVCYISVLASGGARTITPSRSAAYVEGGGAGVAILSGNRALFTVHNTGDSFPLVTFVNGIN